MELLGLSLLEVLAAFGAAAIAVTGLYLLKLRRKTARVAFLPLWGKVLSEKRATRFARELRRLWSFLLSLLILALLALALGDPRWKGARRDARNVVLLIDTSASMGATDVRPSRLEKAREAARRFVREASSADRILVATFDASVTPLSPLSSESALLTSALDKIAPTDVASNYGRAIRFGLDALRGEAHSEIVLYTDGAGFAISPELEAELRRSNTRLSSVRVGAPGANLAVTQFAVRRYPLDKTQSEVLVEVTSHAADSAMVELVLRADGEVIDVSTLSIPSGASQHRFLANIGGASRTMEASIRRTDGGKDLLPNDNQAFARVPERKRANVLVVTRGNLYLEAALLLDEYLHVETVAPEAYRTSRDHDAVIFDNFVPPELPDASAFFLNPVGMTAPVRAGEPVERPFFETIDRRHALVQHTALSDVNVARSLQLFPGESDVVVARDSRTPLFVVGERNGRRFAILGFDLADSDLPLRVAWPLLLLNTLDWFAEDSTEYISSVRTGDVWSVRAPAGATLEIVSPEGTRTRHVAPADGLLTLSEKRAGIYELRSIDGTFRDAIAANIGAPAESDLESQNRLLLHGQPIERPTRGTARLDEKLWPYFVLTALALLFFEWFTFHRRWTV